MVYDDVVKRLMKLRANRADVWSYFWAPRHYLRRRMGQAEE